MLSEVTALTRPMLSKYLLNDGAGASMKSDQAPDCIWYRWELALRQMSLHNELWAN